MIFHSDIPRQDFEAGDRVQAAIDRKTKPPGSLGDLERLAVEIARMQATDSPSVDPARLYVVAGDHGIVAEGVSAWPQEVTAQMVANFLAGGAAANAFARIANCGVVVVDAGVASPVPDSPELVRAGIRAGTRNSTLEDALTDDEADRAWEFGADLAKQADEAGIRCVLLGEMGIGNSSSAALVIHALTGIELHELVGPGAGLGPAGLAEKTGILRAAAARYAERLSGRRALAAFGGLEIATLAGIAYGAAIRRKVVLVDGFIAMAAVMAASAVDWGVRDYCLFGHRSAEPGHGRALDWLCEGHLLDFRMRLGEGTGALLALPVLRAACAICTDMAEFEEAGVSGPASPLP